MSRMVQHPASWRSLLRRLHNLGHARRKQIYHNPRNTMIPPPHWRTTRELRVRHQIRPETPPVT